MSGGIDPELDIALSCVGSSWDTLAAVSEDGATAQQLFAELAGRPSNAEVMPGVTVQEYRQMLTPRPAPPGSRWSADVVYGNGGRNGRPLLMDMYARSPGEERPGIVFIHGGAWRDGHRHMLVGQAFEMAANGYVTATISYRLAAEARWPAALEDASCAVRWMRAHADEIGLDPRRIVVAGASAGGHLAAMVALTPGRFEGAGGWPHVSSDVCAAVLYEPALDLRDESLSDQLRPSAEDFFGGDWAVAGEASPITHITPACPPILTRVGEKDQITPALHCETFHNLLNAAGVANRLEVLPGTGHGQRIYDHRGCVRAMTAFLASHLAAVCR
jgi:acetyl esterase